MGLQHTAPPCSSLQHALQHTATHTATHCNTRCITLQHTATHGNTLQHTATDCNTLQHTATRCNTLQHTTRHCKTLQHPAAHIYAGCSQWVAVAADCYSLRLTATHCNCNTVAVSSSSSRLLLTATHGNTLQLQHTSTHCATHCNRLVEGLGANLLLPQISLELELQQKYRACELFHHQRKPKEWPKTEIYMKFPTAIHHSSTTWSYERSWADRRQRLWQQTRSMCIWGLISTNVECSSNTWT